MNKSCCPLKGFYFVCSICPGPCSMPQEHQISFFLPQVPSLFHLLRPPSPTSVTLSFQSQLDTTPRLRVPSLSTFSPQNSHFVCFFSAVTVFYLYPTFLHDGHNFSFANLYFLWELLVSLAHTVYSIHGTDSFS